MFELSFQTDLDPIAIYAAVVATIVLLWDIIKWLTSGPKLILSCFTGRELIGESFGSSQFDGKTLTHVKAQNRGAKATTINSMVVKHYKNHWDLFFDKPENQGIIPNPKITQDFPYSLDPGAEWSGGIDESTLQSNWKNNGLLVCELYHSFSNKPATARLKFNKKEKDDL